MVGVMQQEPALHAGVVDDDDLAPQPVRVQHQCQGGAAEQEAFGTAGIDLHRRNRRAVRVERGAVALVGLLPLGDDAVLVDPHPLRRRVASLDVEPERAVVVSHIGDQRADRSAGVEAAFG